MNWDNQMSSIISAADGSVAKIRECLATHGRFTRGNRELYEEREVCRGTGLDPPVADAPCQCSASIRASVQYGDLAAIQAQLSRQSQVIDTLVQNLQAFRREKHDQQRQIQTLQGELQRLQEQEEKREKEGERESEKPRVERRMEQWTRDVSQELNSMRGHINRAASLSNLGESLNSRLCREEVGHLRREVAQLRDRLMTQEEEVFEQQSEARETRRQLKRSCKMLESLTDSYRTHSIELGRAICQHTHTQQEIRQLRTTVAQLSDDVRALLQRDRPPVVGPETLAVTMETRSLQPVLLDSDDDFSPAPSLGEVSSDEEDNSWLEKKTAAQMRGAQIRRFSVSLKETDARDSGNGLCHSHGNEGDQMDSVSDSLPELNLSDL